MSTLVHIEFTVPAEKAEECGLYLNTKVRHGWEETPKDNDIVFKLYLDDHPLGDELARDIETRWPGCALSAVKEEPEDWAMAWKDFFNPVSCGERFEILPPWLASESNPDMTPIIIEPKMAFGTGHHPTTALCLEAIGKFASDGVLEAPTTFLDLGTGSGILAIALAKLGLTGDALDIDPQAVSCALENAEINQVADSVRFVVGSSDCLAESARYGFIVANILSGPLIELSPEILAHLDDSAPLVLSGILTDQAEAVARSYVVKGLPQPEFVTSGEWAALIWNRT